MLGKISQRSGRIIRIMPRWKLPYHGVWKQIRREGDRLVLQQEGQIGRYTFVSPQQLVKYWEPVEGASYRPSSVPCIDCRAKISPEEYSLRCSVCRPVARIPRLMRMQFEEGRPPWVGPVPGWLPGINKIPDHRPMPTPAPIPVKQKIKHEQLKLF